jgi:ribonuclease D
MPLTWEALADILDCPHVNVIVMPTARAIKHGLLTPPLPKPVNHRPAEAVLERLEILREWRKETARKLEVESDVVLPRDVMELIANKAPATRNDLRELMQETGALSITAARYWQPSIQIRESE